MYNNSITTPVDIATDLCSRNVGFFIVYIQSLDPDLRGHEAISVAAKIISQLPRAFKENQKMLDELKTECEAVKQVFRK